jgi:hypothetical protein
MGKACFLFPHYRSLYSEEIFYDIRYEVPTELSNISVRAYMKKNSSSEMQIPMVHFGLFSAG